MKILVSLVALAAATLVSCGSNQSKTVNSPVAQQSETKAPSVQVKEVTSGPGAVVVNYLNLKNELANDKSDGAATVGGKLLKSIKELGSETMTAGQKKVYSDLSGDIEENADHISKNGGNIKHQREHFENLSQDMLAFIKAFGTPQTLYKDYCPMKKAYWLSEAPEINNPYFGHEMSDCGEIQDTLQVAK